MSLLMEIMFDVEKLNGQISALKKSSDLMNNSVNEYYRPIIHEIIAEKEQEKSLLEVRLKKFESKSSDFNEGYE